jgi:hypothetical protein
MDDLPNLLKFPETGVRQSGKGAGPTDMLYKFFLFHSGIIIYRLYQLPFRPSSNNSATVCQTFRFSINICSLSTVAGRTEIFFTANQTRFRGEGAELHTIIYTRTENLRHKFLLWFGLMIVIFRSVKILQALDKARTLI